MSSEINNIYLEAFKQNHIAVVTLKEHVFELITSLTESQVLMDFLREAENDSRIKGLLLLNKDNSLGEEVYEQFVRGILKGTPLEDNNAMPDFTEKNTRFRQINILNKFIRYLAGYHKVVITGIDSILVTPFMGVTLVADIRLISPRGGYALAHRKYGLHPSGAIPYFLTHYLGHSKAMEIQLSGNVSAEEAFRLGLVSQILPSDNFTENCIRYVQPYLKNCHSTLQMTKRLNNFKHRWLEEYFEHEGGLMNL